MPCSWGKKIRVLQRCAMRRYFKDAQPGCAADAQCWWVQRNQAALRAACASSEEVRRQQVKECPPGRRHMRKVQRCGAQRGGGGMECGSFLERWGRPLPHESLLLPTERQQSARGRAVCLPTAPSLLPPAPRGEGRAARPGQAAHAVPGGVRLSAAPAHLPPPAS